MRTRASKASAAAVVIPICRTVPVIDPPPARSAIGPTVGELPWSTSNVTHPDTCRWLLTLVWPEYDDRREGLEQALEIVRLDPPAIRRGDLVQELPGLVAEALAKLPEGGVLVVFHSALIAYLHDPRRELVAA